jgi:hypothetical protein
MNKMQLEGMLKQFEQPTEQPTQWANPSIPAPQIGTGN